MIANKSFSLCFSIPLLLASAFEPMVASAQTPEEDFQKLLAEDRRAASLSGKDQKEAYQKLKYRMNELIAKHLFPERYNTAKFVQATFRRGTYSHFAKMYRDAHHDYLECTNHPKLSEAIWKGKPLIETLTVYDSKVSHFLERPGESNDTVIVETYHHTKGSISKVNHVPLGKAHSPLSAKEMLQISLRQRAAYDENAAERIGRQLLGDAGLTFDVEASDGVVVFGVTAVVSLMLAQRGMHRIPNGSSCRQEMS